VSENPDSATDYNNTGVFHHAEKLQKFSTNWFVKNFIQFTYKSDIYSLNM